MLDGANGERASVILLQPSSQSHNHSVINHVEFRPSQSRSPPPPPHPPHTHTLTYHLLSFKNISGKPDKNWWDKIIQYKGARRSGEMSSYFGWLVEFVEDTKSIVCHLFTSGLLSVPLEITTPDGTTKDTAALVAGMLGFTLYEDDVPVVQPFQGWSLMLPEDSPFRSKTAA